MSKKSQKEAVVEQVLLQLPDFTKYSDNAILKLSSQQLENIKTNIYSDIVNGVIEYGKDINHKAEVRSYARSMVMNHLKKAKELNGGYAYVSTNKTSTSGSKSSRQKMAIAPKGVNLDLLTDELREYVKSLV